MSFGRRHKKEVCSVRVVVCYLLPLALVSAYVLGLLYFTSRMPKKHYLIDHRIPPVQYDRFLTIIILTYNSAILSQQLQMLASMHRPYSIHITVADNGCLPATQATIQQYRNMTSTPMLTWSHLELCNNVPYAAANNYAVDMSPSSNWLLFLNDDVIPHSTDFFSNLARIVKTAEVTHADIGAIGCKLLFKDGRLMEAGSIVHATGKTDNFLRDGNSNDPQTNFSRIVHYCSAACLFVERNAFIAASGFDQAHYPGYFEDTHLQMHITHRQQRQVLFSADLLATHVEHATFGSGTAKQMMSSSGETFRNLWAEELATLHPHQPTCDLCNGALSAHLLARDVRSLYAVKILVMLDAAMLSAIYSLLCQLQVSGLYLVTVLLTSSHVSDNIIHMMQGIGVEILDSSISLAGLLSERHGYYHMLFISNSHLLPPYVNKHSGTCTVSHIAVRYPTSTYDIPTAPSEHAVVLTVQASLQGSISIIVNDVIAVHDSCWNSVDGLYFYMSFVTDRFGAVAGALKYSGKYSAHVPSTQSRKQVLTLLRAVRGDDRILNRYEIKMLKKLYSVVKPRHHGH